DDALGLRGTYLACCMVRKEVMACTPTPTDAQIDMGAHDAFLRLKADQKGLHLLPTDIVQGTDGSLFFADFYNDTSRRTNQVSGSIYRITRKDRAMPTRPSIDFTSTAGLVAALKNPNRNVRSHAAAQLVQQGDSARAAVTAYLKSAGDDSYLRARGIWVLAQLGEAGRADASNYLTHDDPQTVITAYRALRLADPGGILARASQLAVAESAAVRREVALSLRDTPFAESAEILKSLIAGYDGRNRYYLEALGTAFTGKEDAVYRELVAPQFAKPASWSNAAKNLAWRLHTADAIRDLDLCIRAQQPPVDEFRHLAMAFASFRSDADRTDRVARLSALAKLPAFGADYYQSTVREIIERDLNDLTGELLTKSFPVPKEFGTVNTVSEPQIIAELAGSAERGKGKIAACYMCHKIAGAGVAFGPELTHWGQARTIEQIVHEIVLPDAHLAHGYDRPARVSGRGHVAEGMLMNYSHHAGSLKLKVMGGAIRKILFRRSGAKVEYPKESWMPSAAEMGLSDQDVRDIAEYLKHLEAAASPVLAATAAIPKGDEPGWQVLTGEDFENVNCRPDTWRWERDHAYCTGSPTGVIRYREPLVNFELLCEWMHRKKAGNSGIFVWATPRSIARLAAGHGRLPHGIEVQVLDLGYAEYYIAHHKKPADWFTSHGDVFPVGPIKMRPFPPVAPNGRRSFPSKETTKGINEWNHYYVRAVDGVVRLWVNGEEVSGGDGISPASGYLCLESEGSPIEFRNLRLRVLPSKEKADATFPKVEPVKALDLKGHVALGTWHYSGHTREVSADGFVTLRNGESINWKRRCISKTADGFVLEGNLKHTLKGDTLHIEGRYQAKRK
ncbi:MAG: putative heme-binding domain-containing protein, partial [Rhodothermales bacterium]